MIESTARLAILIPTPVAMPEAMEPISPDIIPPPLCGATAGGGADGVGAGGGAICGGEDAGGGAERCGDLAEVRAPLLRGIVRRIHLKATRATEQGNLKSLSL